MKRIWKTVLFSYFIMFLVSNLYFYFLVNWYDNFILVTDQEEKRQILKDIFYFYSQLESVEKGVNLYIDRCNVYYFQCSNHIRYMVIPINLEHAIYCYMRIYNFVVTEHYPVYGTHELNLVYRENLELLLKHFNIEFPEVDVEAPTAMYFFFYKWFTLRFFSIILTRYFSSRGLLPNKDFKVNDNCYRFVIQSWFYLKWKITVRIVFFGTTSRYHIENIVW